ncbi:hypothetical protein KNP414_02298 [Paenibacillus mucilaginosus KNP414]|uniref:Uncharacterized protein n=1 Tax=Paenibacillus mucilaginosus (strain KNP414) TaxID=1036673 RepID=F8F7V5_PAEMK|nr:hypothetical protein KNP414_02298 [Paenibacillus mucilaginosus KNP414]
MASGGAGVRADAVLPPLQAVPYSDRGNRTTGEVTVWIRSS